MYLQHTDSIVTDSLISAQSMGCQECTFFHFSQNASMFFASSLSHIPLDLSCNQEKVLDHMLDHQTFYLPVLLSG